MPVNETTEVEVEYYDCSHCGRAHTTIEGAGGCCPHRCGCCGERHMTLEEANQCCYRCSSCGTRYQYEEDADDCCSHRCPDCGESYETERAARRCCGDQSDETDNERTTMYHLIHLDRASKRRPRLVSVEQEISHGFDQVDQLWRDNDWHVDPVFRVDIKGDGSLADDGVEIEYSKMNLYESQHAELFSEQMSGVRDLRNTREIRTGSRAGTHIHVSAHDLDGRRVTPKTLASVYGAFCHCEGAIYRIAAAGWARHRREEAENDYASILPKKQDMKLKDVLTMQQGGNRYYGVSQSRIMEAVHNCQCGAVKVGDWQDCSCDYWRSATWEWRVFNSTTRPRTMHAWILLALGLTDWAIRHDCIRLPIHGYDVNSSREGLQEQVDFILGFNFTDEEREVVREAISMSPGLGHTVQ